MLKAYLVAKNIEFNRTHSLEYLLEPARKKTLCLKRSMLEIYHTLR
ncbi:HEPN domain-containing protein [Patescibacteria group bacterium]|nr:HEPN domain-containing protein [Candidatus Omnitrophota bacterium]MBU1685677.1 HEPN domain-containing protein [Patescibacteria group bacterium]MBU1784285.1 HEPN domain-containing protein [Candidatus Omnitrophota bacterium]MBU1851103.1 HEPN domain-containing protein [Candidatus Omnitrophota bacterium]